MNIDQIRAHIDELIRQKGKKYRSLSLSIGKNEAYLHQFINKGSPLRLPEEQRRKLAQILEVDEQELTDIQLPKTLEPICSHKQTALIEMISSSKAPNSPQDTTGFWSLPFSDFSNITSSSPQSVKMLRVCGDSMSPTLKEGDFVLADFSNNFFNADGLYLISSAGSLFVKRLQQLSSSELMIISDNINYKNITQPLKKIDIAGKIILILRSEKVA